MSKYKIASDLHDMVPGGAGTATPKVIFKSEDGILLCYGITKPADEATGYAPGCIFIDIDGSSSTTVIAVNIGSKASANFDYLTIN